MLSVVASFISLGTKIIIAMRQYMFAYSQLFEETETHYSAVCTVMHHQQLSGRMRQSVNITVIGVIYLLCIEVSLHA